MNVSFKERMFIIIGSLFVITGLLANEWLMRMFFSHDGGLMFSSKIIILVFDVIFVGVGYFFIRKNKILALKKVDKKNFILLCIVIIIGFVSTESVLRFWLYKYASEKVFGHYATYSMIQKRNLRYSRHPYLSYYPTPNYRNNDGDRHNSLGFRGEEIELPKPDGTYRIVAFGGSTTYTTHVKNYKESYPYLLEQELHKMGYDFVDVVNAGVPYYDSWTSLINVAFRIFDLDPDLIIYYEGDNEMKSRMVYPLSKYIGDNTGKVMPPPIPNTKFIDKFVTTRILFYRLGIISDYSDLAHIHDAPSLVHHEYLKQVKEGTYPSGIFKDIKIMKILESNTPVYTRRNIENIAAMASAQDVQFMIASFAYSPQVGIRTKTEVYQKAIKEHNQVLKEVANKWNVLFYDFAKEMPPYSKYWIRDGVHMTKDGALLKASLFAAFLSDHLPWSIKKQ